MTGTVLASLNDALHMIMAEDSSVFLMGEDILDPYGGAFRVTKGLSTKYPDRVFTTPISEAGIVGVAIGMSMRGLRPVVEIMFGDFLTLAADQLVNHAAKFVWMYNGRVKVPLVIRTPMGGRRGYGPTHSQSLEKLFFGIPGLKVVAPNHISSPGELLRTAIFDDEPVIFVEHKLLYPLKILDPAKNGIIGYRAQNMGGTYPAVVLTPEYPATVTIASYGYNVELILPAIEKILLEYELFCDLVIFSQIAPLDISPLVGSLGRTGRLLTVEEGTLNNGWGAEVVAKVMEAIPLKACKRVAAQNLPIANSRMLEDRILPSIQDIVDSVIKINDIV